MSTPIEEIHPYVWWVKITHVPDAPDSFLLAKDGTLLGRWNDGTWVCPLDDERMRLYGYEKCFCSPFEGQPAPDCIAHVLAGKRV